MLFSHSPQLLDQFPAVVGRHLVGHWRHRGPDVADTTRPFLERATARLAQRPESEFPEIAAWRRAHSARWVSNPPSTGARRCAMRRFRKRDGSLPSIHPLVDMCNAVSLAYAIPIAVFDPRPGDRKPHRSRHRNRDLRPSLAIPKPRKPAR